MPLTNAQYDRIEREYGRRRRLAEQEREERIAQVNREIPEFAAVEARLADLAYARNRARITGNAMEEALKNEQMENLRSRRNRLLAQAGYSPDWLEIQFACPLCRDTGYVDGSPCSCRRRAVIDLLYDQSTIRENLERENFSTFRLDYYDNTEPDPATGLTARARMEKNLEVSRAFIEQFPGAHDNLLLTGQAGTGKTFLSNCIAAELLNRCFSVLYLSAPQLFDVLAKQAFERREEAVPEEAGQVYTCDLLIIDDLGTELVNRFVASGLFTCINERILRRKSTLISTNLGMNDMLDIYSERVTSRLMGHYKILSFPDQDIRIKKRMQTAPFHES